MTEPNKDVGAPSFSPYLFSKQRFLDPEVASHEVGNTGFERGFTQKFAHRLFGEGGLTCTKAKSAEWLIGFTIHDREFQGQLNRNLGMKRRIQSSGSIA